MWKNTTDLKTNVNNYSPNFNQQTTNRHISILDMNQNWRGQKVKKNHPRNVE